ncbi:MAG: hypothetical protein DF168_01168 [Candidatus Moanabacter tarae]|uniref:Uncharacterized protein n=1 Tax=Candidatus Moanibacter tarae TaxID=2200854 RepID=A0A2Z4ACT5_9BACT|nr:MAG: hypothetical protein DF168_01168 [Candidatus Moanabacter tarae]|tara:strand:+ start:573 stop:1691 length:1119 start_codon:yes stop_codon:yes gene_type:complete
MNYKEIALQELEKKGSALSTKNALVGFDGTVTKTASPCNLKSNSHEDNLPIESITSFAQRIQGASEKEVGFNLDLPREQIGGIGPSLAQALIAFDLNVRYIGALGHPSIHPIFQEFAKRTNAVSLCNPSVILKLKFDDGTISLSTSKDLSEITYAGIVEKLGEGALFDVISRADLMAMVNWSDTPNMTAILSALLDRVFPNLGPREQGRIFFFDLPNLIHRTDGDINTALSTISRFRSHGQVTLGLNLEEAKRISSVLGKQLVEENAEGIKEIISHIRQELSLTCVTVQSEASAGCTTKEDTWWIEGSNRRDFQLRVGIENEFKAGFITAQLIGLSTPACLTLAAAAADTYAHTGKHPSVVEVNSQIRDSGT